MGDTINPTESDQANLVHTASDNSTSLANTIRGLKKFNGRNPAEFKGWMKKLCVVLGVTRRDILPLLKGDERPSGANTTANTKYARANEDLYAILYLLVELPAALSVQKHEDESEISGDGQATFQELCENYDKVTDEVIRATMEELQNTHMNAGENPDDYWNQKHLLRLKAEKMGERVSDRWFKDICVSGFTDEYKDVKMMMYRDPTFDVVQMQTTMRHMFLDEKSRKGSRGRIAGRGIAMNTTSEDITCFECHESGHTRRDCPQAQAKNPQVKAKHAQVKKKRTKPAGAPKWCSVHNTTTHSDEECYMQGAKRPERKGKAFSACSHCTHCSTTDNAKEAVTSKEASNEKRELDFTMDGDDFNEGFMYAMGNSGRVFTPNALGATLLVDTGATETMVDSKLIPGIRIGMKHYKQLKTPKTITVGSDHELKGTATGTVHCIVRDGDGDQQPMHLPVLLVPGLGRNIFAPTAYLKMGMRFLLEADTPHLKVDDTTIPLKQHRLDQGMCSLDITFKATPQTTVSGKPVTSKPARLSFDQLLNIACVAATATRNNTFGKPTSSRLDDRLNVAYSAASASADTWHRRLGHMNPRSMDLLRKKEGNGVEYLGDTSPCSVCTTSKSKQLAHPKTTTRKTTRPMQLVYTDNMGPFTPAAKGGYRYACKFTDDFSRMKEAYLLKDKTETARALYSYNIHVAAALGFRLECLRCDRGGENTGKEFTTLCTASAIKIEYAATNTPQQNGVSERDGQTLATVTRCLMKDGQFPSFLWGELLLTAVYLCNRAPHSGLRGDTPFFKMHGKEADTTRLRVIGARAFVHHERYVKKLDDRAFEGKLCGFSQDSKAYRIYNPSNGNDIESRNVTFTETPPCTFPMDYSGDAYDYEGDILRFTSVFDDPATMEDTFDERDNGNLDSDTENVLLREEIRHMRHNNMIREELRQEETPAHEYGPDTTSSPTPSSTDPSPEQPQLSPGASRETPRTTAARLRGISRPLQVTRAGTRRNPNPTDAVDASLAPRALDCTLNEAATNMAVGPTRIDPSALNSAQLLEIASKTRHADTTTTRDFAHMDEDTFPVPRAFMYATGSPTTTGFLEETSQVIKIPNSYNDAMNSPQREQWKEAIGKEMDSLNKHEVYELVPITSVPKEEKILGSRFVFKQKADGRFKARLVVQGHVQEAGLDYGRSYAPVCRIGSVRTLLAVACEHGWPVWQMDVVVAFLQSTIDKDVWVKPAPGGQTREPSTGTTMVYKLKRSLYGLAQSPVLWYDTIDGVLVVVGFRPTQSDPCVYVHGSGDTLVLLTLYVDDILISGKDPALISKLKKELKDRFEMTDMGEVKLILGMEVQRNYEEGTLTITQQNYVHSILERYGMQDANAASTPGYGQELSTNQPEDKLLGASEAKRYQSITGSILYLAQCTRFDLTYAANQLTRACSGPGQVHMTAAKHVLRYLRGTPDLPIIFKRGQFRMTAYTDASFGANPDNRKSTTGYLFFLGGGLISFGSKTQTLTAQSTVESELQALSYSAREAVYLSNFLLELGFKNFVSVPINSDSAGALSVAGNSMFSSRTKHIALRYFFLRELIKRHKISIHHKPSQLMLADIATKHLSKQQFTFLLKKIQDFQC